MRNSDQLVMRITRKSANRQHDHTTSPVSAVSDKYACMPLAVKTRRGEIRPNLDFLFAYLNDRYFNGAIRGFSVRYGTNMLRCYGYTNKLERMINVSWALIRVLRRKQFSTLVGTLLHEMCHAYLYLYDTGIESDLKNQLHGAPFNRLLDKMESCAKRLGHRWHLRVAPTNASRDISRAYPEFRWRCRQCRETRATLVSRDINRDAVLSFHRGCWRRDAWSREN